MPSRKIPVYNIDDFKQFEDGKDFYANTLSRHLALHHFVNVPHKHDFYITVLITKGTGKHEIDFSTYDVKPGYVFFLSPGQTHNWQLSKNCDGYIFFHSATFYDLNFTSKKIKDYLFFSSVYNLPLLQLNAAHTTRLKPLFNELLNEYTANAWMKYSKLCSLADLIYIELTRLYSPLYERKEANEGYLDKIRKLEDLVDKNFKTIKFPKDYAEMMNLSEKHLNRICKSCLNKTTTDVISDRIILEAKRILVISKASVSQVAEQLGYTDYAYFSRLFRKKCNQTPLEFAKQYKELVVIQ